MNETKENMNLKFAGEERCEDLLKKGEAKECIQCEKGQATVGVNLKKGTTQNCESVSTFVSISR